MEVRWWDADADSCGSTVLEDPEDNPQFCSVPVPGCDPWIPDCPGDEYCWPYHYIPWEFRDTYLKCASPPEMPMQAGDACAVTDLSSLVGVGIDVWILGSQRSIEGLVWW